MSDYRFSITRDTSQDDWDRMTGSQPGAHLLQTWEWGQVKTWAGWQPSYLTWVDSQDRLQSTALLLSRQLIWKQITLPISVLYIPKGPLFDWGNPTLRSQVLDDLQLVVRQKQAIFLKIDPDVIYGMGEPDGSTAVDNPLGTEWQQELKQRGWQYSNDQIQFRNTVLVDLTPSEAELLVRMKQKTRYNLHLAIKKGVTVRVGDVVDFDMLYRMFAETAVRDKFIIREEAYYHKVWETFTQAGMAEPLIAEVGGEPVAAIIVFRFCQKAWYLYGMSRSIHRELMPNVLLQWEAMRRSKQAGCQVYDLWGAPEEFNDSDPLWGVYRFKQGLGGQVVRTLGAWDYPARPVLYRSYTGLLPRILDMLRQKSQQKTSQLVEMGVTPV